jgi:hypothetical protein
MKKPTGEQQDPSAFISPVLKGKGGLLSRVSGLETELLAERPDLQSRQLWLSLILEKRTTIQDGIVLAMRLRSPPIHSCTHPFIYLQLLTEYLYWVLSMTKVKNVTFLLLARSQSSGSNGKVNIKMTEWKR